MFLQNLRAKVGARLNGDSEAGFTLIELLVVMLILGILAAIALPAFFNQKDKAGDAKAKENAHSAQVAMETYSTDHNGSYVGATVERTQKNRADDRRSARQRPKAKPRPPARESVASGVTATGYTIESISSNGHVFKVMNDRRNADLPLHAERTRRLPDQRKLERIVPSLGLEHA